MSSLNFGENKRRSPRGGCGLKFLGVDTLTQSGMSLSSRRAWIEIRKAASLSIRSPSRSPRGGRGLKSEYLGGDRIMINVALLAEGVD